MRISDWSSDVCSSDLGDLAVGTPVLQPLADGANVVRRHAAAVLEAQQVLQQHLHGIGQARNVAELRGGRLQTVVAVGLAADLEVAAGLQGVFGWPEGSLLRLRWAAPDSLDRKSTRLNSSH